MSEVDRKSQRKMEELLATASTHERESVALPAQVFVPL
jgi:hypothetical protein